MVTTLRWTEENIKTLANKLQIIGKSEVIKRGDGVYCNCVFNNSSFPNTFLGGVRLYIDPIIATDMLSPINIPIDYITFYKTGKFIKVLSKEMQKKLQIICDIYERNTSKKYTRLICVTSSDYNKQGIVFTISNNYDIEISTNEIHDHTTFSISKGMTNTDEDIIENLCYHLRDYFMKVLNNINKVTSSVNLLLTAISEIKSEIQQQEE